MVYSPYQNFDSVYDPRQGLCNGTIFSGLDKPFYGDGRGC
ncbi:MAG: spore coat associated protein CotJA [Ruminococcaceae bacterium]|nr:spore coat associated protein CotJA [Oscillospiraceae bacterium]